MGPDELMVLGALLVALPTAAWLLGARNWTTVTVMQLALAAQLALMGVSFWRMNEQATKERECQPQQQEQQTTRQVVFCHAVGCYVKATPNAVGEIVLEPLIVTSVAAHEEAEQPQYAVPSFQSTDAFQQSPVHHSLSSNELSNLRSLLYSPYEIPNAEVTGRASAACEGPR